jgi:hypothetical protein
VLLILFSQDVILLTLSVGAAAAVNELYAR